MSAAKAMQHEVILCVCVCVCLGLTKPTLKVYSNKCNSIRTNLYTGADQTLELKTYEK